MCEVAVHKRMMRKKEMIRRIQEMLLDSFLGEEWERDLDYLQVWDYAEVTASYLQEKCSIAHFTEEEVRTILKVSVDFEQMTSDGYEFLTGRKVLLAQIKKEKYGKLGRLQDSELLFTCMQRELALAIYEKVWEYEDSKWILEQEAFVEQMTGFAWLYVCMERMEAAEIMIPALDRFFPNTKQKKEAVELVLQNVENFAELLGELWINQADGFDKVCCMTEGRLDISMLGERFVKRVMQKQIPEQGYWVSDSVFLSVNSSNDN